ncbi:histidine kinase [Rasiella rasia]|uniref:Histidine kinase n=1 Tax=Rasiella rasia TaxID=2744027 RepID=A0A6G6GN96_9FLAO|nr:histidine kinase [Rasiella rasia]
MLHIFLKKYKYAPIHVLFWVFVWLFYVYFFSYNNANNSFVFWFSASLLPVTIAATYIFSNELIPKYLLLRKYLLFTLYSAYTVIGSLFLILLVVFFGFMMKAYFNMEELPLLIRNFVFVFILVYLVVGSACFVNVLRYNYKTSNQNRELQNKLLEGALQLKQKELYYLKQQIHPHFLFNALNTIYAAALKESKDTPELVLKLSNLLDYVLHQIEKPHVSIYDEVTYIESYVGLERVRFKDSLVIHFKKEIDSAIMVPPMLFMAFVENAFKHGGRVENVLYINIDLKVTKQSLFFKIENSLNITSNNIDGHGLGLANTRERLDKQYPGNYSLSSTKEDQKYQVILEVNLEKPETYV